MTIFKWLLRGMIRSYQLFLTPIIHSLVPVRGGCRFHPSCSAYAHEAVKRFGFFPGGWLMLKRLARCHPWGGSGVDPVPDRLPDSHPSLNSNSSIGRQI